MDVKNAFLKNGDMNEEIYTHQPEIFVVERLDWKKNLYMDWNNGIRKFDKVIMGYNFSINEFDKYLYFKKSITMWSYAYM